MYQGVFKIAGLQLEIRSIHSRVQELCREYRASGDPEMKISITQADIESEREKSRKEDQLEGIPVREFADDYLETLAVYRQIARKMLERSTLLFHGSSVAVDGEGYLFTAISGTGKSTHTRLWRQLLGERALMVNDDKPLLRVEKDRTWVCGTPWNGKHGLGNPVTVPLKAICYLQRGRENRIRQTSARELLPVLVQQSYRPDTPEGSLQLMKILDLLCGNVKFYILQCNMEPEAARVSYLAMHGPDPKL